MIHIDEKFKDARPEDTVERIIGLLRTQGIEVLEDWIDSGIENCFSVRVTIKGTTLGANGKGVTKVLARASGYAELTERLQSGFLGFGTLKYGDARQMTAEEFISESGSILQRMADRIANFEQIPFTADDLLATCFSNCEQVNGVPYLNACDGTTVYLPVSVIPRLYSTNGLAAGNSTEEAIVQGFSEIVERYCHCRILHEGLVPPTIPRSFLQQFSTAYSIICALEDAGFTVLVKDCSLGEGYPVVASVLINKKTHGYRVILGSSPIFEIALERSLTEMLQGTSVRTMPFTTGFYTAKVRSGKDISNALVKGGGTYTVDFFEGEASYPFVPFPDRSDSSNSALVGYITEYLSKHQRTMLIRDLSHFGFPTLRMIVPGMSEVFTFSFTGKPSYIQLTNITLPVAADLRNASPEQLVAYTVQYASTPTAVSGPLFYTNISRLPLDAPQTVDRFFGLMSAAYAEWVLGNLAQCMRHINTALPYAPEEEKEYLNLLRQYLILRATGKSTQTVLEQLRLFYADEKLETLASGLRTNPFASLFPLCDDHCDACRWKGICRKDAHGFVKKQLNLAAAEFDNEAAFANLRTIFGRQ